MYCNWHLSDLFDRKNNLNVLFLPLNLQSFLKKYFMGLLRLLFKLENGARIGNITTRIRKLSTYFWFFCTNKEN
jgi:hypothetical protein